MIRRLRTEDEGFTLAELLVVIAIMPLIAGSIAAGFFVTMSNKNDTQSRLSDSHDAQITSEYFVRDVKNAAQVTTGGPTMCGKPSYLLGLAWYPSPTDTTLTSESVYWMNGGLLTRTTCGSSSGSATLAHDWNPQTSANGTVAAAVTVDCSDGSHTCASGSLAPATSTDPTQASVDQITMHVVESHTNYTFNVSASPNGWSVTGAGCQHSANGCPGHATPPPLHMIGSDSSINLGPNCNVTVTGLAATDNGSSNSMTGGTLSATQIYWPGSNGSPDNDSSAPVVSGPPVADSYSSLTPPTASGSTVVSNGSLPSLLNGIYYVTAPVTINSPVTDVAANGTANPALIYLAPGAYLDMKGSGSLTIQKAVSPQYDPIVLWAAGADPSKTQEVITLNGGSALAGAIYAPKGTVLLNGGGSTGQVSATFIAANGIACNGGGASVGFGAGPVATSTTVSATPNPVVDGKTVTLTAHVDAADKSTVNGGSVAFTVRDGNGTVTADCATPVNVNSNGDATCQTSPLSATLSKFTVTASYQGTANYGPSTTANALSVNVLKPTTTSLTTSASNLHSGDTASFTATVASGGSVPTKGSVTFTVQDKNGSTIATSTVQTLDSNGHATWTSGKLLAGSAPYSVTASYTDGNNTTTSVYADSTSNPLSVPVSVASTMTSVLSSKPTTRPGGSVTFTATVSPTPDAGTVAWVITSPTDPNPPACSPASTAVTNGQATCTITGGWHLNSTYTVTASYSGDSSYSGSSNTASESVAAASTTTTGSRSCASKCNAFTDQATVAAADSTDGTPYGYVIFYLCKDATTGCTPSPSSQVGQPVALTNGTASSIQLTTTGNPKTLSNNKNYCMAVVYQGSVDAQNNPDGNFASSFDESNDQCFTT